MRGALWWSRHPRQNLGPVSISHRHQLDQELQSRSERVELLEADRAKAAASAWWARTRQPRPRTRIQLAILSA